MITRVVFDENTLSRESFAFYLLERTVAIIRAFNFPDEMVQGPDAGVPSYFPSACLYMVRLVPSKKPPEDVYTGEFGMFPLPESTEILVETPVVTGCGTWQMNANCNQKVLDIPGYYRFVLNHDDMVGTVKMYADVYPRSDFTGSGSSATYFGGGV